MKRFAVVLAGCGVFDGAEIHEATLTLLAIKKNGADYQVFAPDVDQHHVINHLTGKEMKEKRNVLVESARIARGQVKPLKEYNPSQFDALIFPGGFGVAKNLCDFAFQGPECTVLPGVAEAIRSTAGMKKPIGALCIAPVLLARILGNVEITIGQDQGTSNAVKSMGAKHVKTTHGEVVIDETGNIFTTPCYMLDASIVQIADGAENIVKAMLKAIK